MAVLSRGHRADSDAIQDVRNPGGEILKCWVRAEMVDSLLFL